MTGLRMMPSALAMSTTFWSASFLCFNNWSSCGCDNAKRRKITRTTCEGSNWNPHHSLLLRGSIKMQFGSASFASLCWPFCDEDSGAKKRERKALQTSLRLYRRGKWDWRSISTISRSLWRNATIRELSPASSHACGMAPLFSKPSFGNN